MLSFFKRKDSPALAGAVDEAASVQAARTRARRRLIGAAVLVGVGIIGFPLLFETQPRPIAVDIPIEIPARDKVPPLKLPPAKDSAVTPPRAAGPVVAETVAEPPAESPPPAAQAAASAAVPASQPARAERVASAPVAATAARAAASAADGKAEAQRAQALLEGKPVAAVSPPAAAASEPRTGRFVVQAGAYSDSATLREARQKVERLGLKTYTQVVETDSGARTRVRVGPFDNRDEAEKAAARIKSAGLAANILSL
ncbi:MAG: SPOR domain-containing protein [Burkholderiaceae bacterium]|nr:SPOR domain-containing protein [Burkholderiaceae bacterium]